MIIQARFLDAKLAQFSKRGGLEGNVRSASTSALDVPSKAIGGDVMVKQSAEEMLIDRYGCFISDGVTTHQ